TGRDQQSGACMAYCQGLRNQVSFRHRKGPSIRWLVHIATCIPTLELRFFVARRGTECSLKMLSHELRSQGIVSSGNCIENPYMLAAPVLDASAVKVSSKFQKLTKAVLLLNGLQEKVVSAELGDHFVKLRVRLK